MGVTDVTLGGVGVLWAVTEACPVSPPRATSIAVVSATATAAVFTRSNSIENNREARQTEGDSAGQSIYGGRRRRRPVTAIGKQGSRSGQPESAVCLLKRHLLTGLVTWRGERRGGERRGG